MSEDTESSPRSLHVLVVDDTEINRLVAGALATSLGHQAKMVVSGADALLALREREFDVVLLDLQMPGMDGLEVAQRMRSHPDPRVRQMHLIAVTGSLHESDRHDCEQAGMDDFLAKPIDSRSLGKALDRCARVEQEDSGVFGDPSAQRDAG